MSKVIRVEREIGGRTLSLETGQIAKLASAAVMATYADSTVLGTVVRADARPGLDFFPMQVDYREKLTASGKFPGGFRKREGAPNEKEILTMRMIDRPIRPLFPDGFIEEIQIQCWVMSHDGQNDTDVLAGVAASAALHISDAPFEGPIATVRVGRIFTEEGAQYVLNPTATQMEYSDLDLVLSGHKDGVNMIEVGAAEITEEDMLGAIEFGMEAVLEICDMIEEFRKKAGAPEKRLGKLVLPTDDIVKIVDTFAGKKMVKLRQIKGKEERSAGVKELRDEMLEKHFQEKQDGTVAEWLESKDRRSMAKEAFRTLEKKTTRKLIVEKGHRADGRKQDEIRSLEMQVGVLARTHGSALFQRGETQSLGGCALGTARDEQVVDGLMPEYSKKFMLHYNFPPFCVGEARRIMGPSRREIGHGALAERSLAGVIPSAEDFPYTVRLISDITESNGSSSMASVCGGCLALMDAGVPIVDTCAGISVGLMSDDKGKEVMILDIIGEEDFFGDMDFKVCGTREGITGIQLDLKARGLSHQQIAETFELARKGRIQIIEEMEEVISEPRGEMSMFAPRLISLKIDPEKIGRVIGPGGKVVRAMQEKYGVRIEVEDDGTVLVSGLNAENVMTAANEVEAIGADIKVGSVYHGTVVSVKDFGAFVELAPGTDGMCHVSQLDTDFVQNVADVVNVGDKIHVKVINVDEQGRIKLSRKAYLADLEPAGSEG